MGRGSPVRATGSTRPSCSSIHTRAIEGEITWSDELFGYKVGDPQADLTIDDLDSAPFMPNSVVIDTAFTWGADRAPRTP